MRAPGRQMHETPRPRPWAQFGGSAHVDASKLYSALSGQPWSTLRHTLHCAERWARTAWASGLLDAGWIDLMLTIIQTSQRRPHPRPDAVDPNGSDRGEAGPRCGHDGRPEPPAALRSSGLHSDPQAVRLAARSIGMLLASTAAPSTEGFMAAARRAVSLSST